MLSCASVRPVTRLQPDRREVRQYSSGFMPRCGSFEELRRSRAGRPGRCGRARRSRYIHRRRWLIGSSRLLTTEAFPPAVFFSLRKSDEDAEADEEREHEHRARGRVPAARRSTSCWTSADVMLPSAPVAPSRGRDVIVHEPAPHFFHRDPFGLVRRSVTGSASKRTRAPRRSCLARSAATSTNRNRL